jgi:hypothetical protein
VNKPVDVDLISRGRGVLNQRITAENCAETRKHLVPTRGRKWIVFVLRSSIFVSLRERWVSG